MEVDSGTPECLQRSPDPSKVASSSDAPQLVLRRPIYSEKTFKEDFPPLSTTKKSAFFGRRGRLWRATLHDVKTLLFRVIPILQWLPSYQRSLLVEDVVAGLTVGILRIPHGMAHAVLATVSPVYGLYTNIFPQLIYTVFGTSRHISVGTMAVISIMVGDAVEKNYQSLYGEDGSLEPPVDEATERAHIASTLTLMVGLLQLLMGLLQFGVITNYLPEPLVRGFTTGATCHCFFSQFNFLFGIELERHTGPFSLLKTYIPFFSSLSSTNTATLLISIACLVLLISVKEIQDIFKDRFRWQLPVEMLVIFLGTLFSHLFDFSKKNSVLTVGEIPSGFPRPHIPSFLYASALLPDAIILSIVSYALCISLANIFAKKHKYEVRANQELFAFGVAHTLSSMMYCYPSTSSLSRTLVRDISGGKTMVAGLISTSLVIAVVMVIGRFMSSLPMCCLAAIIMVAVRGMVRQVTDIRRLWKYSRMDMTIWVVTCLCTVLLGLDYGLACGFAFSLFTVVLRSQRPQCHVLGQFGETGLYGNIKTFADARLLPGIQIMRIQAPIYFANASYVKQRLSVRKRTEPQGDERKEDPGGNNQNSITGQVYIQLPDHRASPDGNHHQSVDSPFIENRVSSGGQGSADTETYGGPVHTLILDLSAVSFLDTVGLNTLEAVAQDYWAAGVKFHLAECRGNVQEMMYSSGLVKSIRNDQMFLSVHDAVLHSQCRTPEILDVPSLSGRGQKEARV